MAVTAVIALLVYTLYDAFFAAPQRFTLRSETLSSEKIPSSMDGITVLFFSDLEYGLFMDADRLAKLTARIRNTAPDIIIFGGDLFAPGTVPDSAMTETVSSCLAQLEAPLGKFAVYGDNDHESEAVMQAVNTVYGNSGFEVLVNKSIALRNRSNASVTLVGLDSTVGGTLDVAAAYQTVSHSNYVIACSHTPDTADLVPADLTDYFLAGHTHGGQAYWIISSLYAPAGSENHLRGKETAAGSFTLDITNGTGTAERDVRLFADAEIVRYTLRHEEKTEASETVSPSSEPSA